MPSFTRPIEWHDNTISVIGQVTTAELRYFASALHVLAERKGYQDIRLDFSECSSAYESLMLPVVAICEKYQAEGTDIQLVLPNNPAFANEL